MKWSKRTLFLCVLVILWGAYVRATGSGAGCGAHWPLCNGDVIPRSPSVQTMIEFFHRASSGISFLAVFALWIYTFRIYPKNTEERKLSTLAFIVMIAEAGIGAVLVLFGYVASDSSTARVFLMSFHLINTLALLAALTALSFPVPSAPSPVIDQRDRKPIALGIFLILALALTGALTALGDTLFPKEVVGFSETVKHLLTRFRFVHPFFAAGVFCYFLWARSRSTEEQGWNTFLILLGSALIVGITNLLLLAPVPLQILHLGAVLLTWISLVRLARDHGLLRI